MPEPRAGAWSALVISLVMLSGCSEPREGPGDQEAPDVEIWAPTVRIEIAPDTGWSVVHLRVSLDAWERDGEAYVLRYGPNAGPSTGLNLTVTLRRTTEGFAEPTIIPSLSEWRTEIRAATPSEYEALLIFAVGAGHDGASFDFGFLADGKVAAREGFSVRKAAEGSGAWLSWFQETPDRITSFGVTVTDNRISTGTPTPARGPGMLELEIGHAILGLHVVRAEADNAAPAYVNWSLTTTVSGEPKSVQGGPFELPLASPINGARSLGVGETPADRFTVETRTIDARSSTTLWAVSVPWTESPDGLKIPFRIYKQSELLDAVADIG